jgi:diguanylate cyclase (GGDEF)-like protein
MKSEGRRIRLRVFLGASLIAAAILTSIVVVPQWLSRQARLDVLRSHVGQVAQLAASVVDGDAHRQLLDPANYSDELYARAVRPLVRFHSANPEIFYVYTMVEREGASHFVLDSASSADLKTRHELRPSGYMERFDLREEYASDWLQRIAAGETWITPSFQEDDYGNFLSAHAPILDRAGRYSGFVGVDFDLQYYLAQEMRFRGIALGSLAAALLVALLVGYLIARYHYSVHHQMETHYNTSVRDGLTGLLNRRGIVNAIDTALARRAPSYAALLIDIDDLKHVNDTLGHAAGDAVIAQVAQAISASVGPDDHCARLGGDEFMVFAADCDRPCASELAQRVLAALSDEKGSAPRPDTGVSIGIVVQDHAGADFDRMYKEADAALYRAKSQGKRCVAVFETFTHPVATTARSL